MPKQSPKICSPHGGSKKESDDAGDYRPITISPTTLRALNSVVASRVPDPVKFSPSQRGFIKDDGVMGNILLLGYLIRRSSKCICLATFDVSKVFDTVSIHSILRVAKNFGMPEAMCAYLTNVYMDSNTVIDYKHVLSVKIWVRTGVKQGDPLSPLLFNMVIDEFFRGLSPNLGVKIGGQTICASAFADDSFNIGYRAGTARTSKLLRYQQFYAKRGQWFNPDKTVLMTGDSANKLYVSNINVAGVKLYSFISGEFFRY
jgi:hypothetical protein